MRPGEFAERFVERYLAEAGWTIEGRNVRLGYLEIDLIAREGRVIVLVEVRGRSPSARTTPFSSVDGLKRRRLRYAAERLWNRRYKNDPSVDRLRLDVASVELGPEGPKLEYARGVPW